MHKMQKCCMLSTSGRPPTNICVLSGNHCETISFHAIPPPHHPQSLDSPGLSCIISVPTECCNLQTSNKEKVLPLPLHTSYNSVTEVLPGAPLPSRKVFFLVEKKDKTFYPCIIYRGLNQMTEEQVPDAPDWVCFWRLPQGTMFVKLDLCKASLGLGKGSSGKQLSIPHLATLNI